jgi:thioredoxin:protein disulfide reductase
MKRTFRHFFVKAALAALSCVAAAAQTPGVLTIAEPAKLVVKRTDNPTLPLKVSIKAGYHANSNTPSEAYLIPLKLTWETGGALEAVEVVYPKPKLEQYDFADKPLSVFGGDFELVTKFRRAANPALGPGFLSGKLRYQACNDKMCLPPKTVEVKLPLLMQ